MKQALVDLFKSKKFLLGLVAVLVYVIGKVGLDIDESIVENVVYIIALVIGGQSMADFGKERAKLLVAAAERADSEDPLE